MGSGSARRQRASKSTRTFDRRQEQMVGSFGGAVGPLSELEVTALPFF